MDMKPTFEMTKDNNGGVTMVYTTSGGVQASTYFNSPPENIDHVCLDYMKGRFGNVRTWKQVDFIKKKYKESFQKLSSVKDKLEINEKDIEFLKELQQELKTQETDHQASPRFWVIKDYRMVPASEKYDSGDEERFFNDGDHVTFHKFSDLKEFLEEYYCGEIDEDQELRVLVYDESERFDELWEYVESNLNNDGYFDTAFMKEEGFIVSDTMFLTKEEAKNHLKLNHYHYTSKAHTYAMTAWRAPKVERLLNILETFDWELISTK